MNLSLTFWPRLTDPHGKRVRTTWALLVARLSMPRTCEAKLEIPGMSLATFAGDMRSNANVERVFAVGLDLDKSVPPWDELCERFSASRAFLHTTWQSTPQVPRARVFLPLSRPVSAREYRRVYAAVSANVAANLQIDRAASDAGRLWFLPAIRPSGSFDSFIGEGPPVDVEAALAAVPEPAPPVPPPPSGPRAAGAGDVEARAAAYVEKVGPAISGSGGRTTTFVLAQRLVRGFALDEDTTYRLMAKWNQICDPPWSERELRGKIREAANAGRQAVGDLRDARRDRRLKPVK